MKRLDGSKSRSPASPEEVISAYESLRALSDQMLACARSRNWEALVEGESRYVVQVEALTRFESSTPLTRHQQSRKAELLEEILERDLEIRRQLMARQEELAAMISQAGRTRRLNRAYYQSSIAISAVSSRFDEGRS